MHRFFFHLRTNGTIVPDTEGTLLPDLEAARAHAEAVAQDLMHDTDDSSRLCSLCVERENEEHAFDVFFADVDTRLLSQSEERRAQARQICRLLSEHTDARRSVRQTLIETHMLLARAKRAPQLAYATTSFSPRKRPRP